MPWLWRSLVEDQQGDFNDIGTEKHLCKQTVATQPVSQKTILNALTTPFTHDKSTTG